LSVTGAGTIGTTLGVGGATTLASLGVTGKTTTQTLNVTGDIKSSNIIATSKTAIGQSAVDATYTLFVNGTVSATSYNASSDRRLKSNIQYLSNQSRSILEITPVTYNWKVDGRRDIGFIAQDIYNTYPEIRPELKSDPSSNIDEPTDLSGNPIYYGIDYGKMTPFLWQGMREIIQRLEILECENQELQKRVEILETK
jgi:hypothetical protein